MSSLFTSFNPLMSETETKQMFFTEDIRTFDYYIPEEHNVMTIVDQFITQHNLKTDHLKEFPKQHGSFVLAKHMTRILSGFENDRSGTHEHITAYIPVPIELFQDFFDWVMIKVLDECPVSTFASIFLHKWIRQAITARSSLQDAIPLKRERCFIPFINTHHQTI